MGRVKVTIFVGLACLLVQVLMGSGDGVVKLFDSSTSKYHWEVNSDPKYPKYASDSLVPRLTFSFHSVLHEKEPVSVVHTSLLAFATALHHSYHSFHC